MAIRFEKDSLRGQLLVAMPSLDGSCFEKAVIYICAHDESGAMGVVVNRAMDNIKYSDILSQLSIKSIKPNDTDVYFGGPVDPLRGFILHTNDYASEGTHVVEENIAITTTVDVLKDIAQGSGPSKSIVALGYTGWSAGQLEQEMMSNSWLNVPSSEEVIFNADNSGKWEKSAMILGVDFFKYSDAVGHA
jgi:putative transcriptional regulator